MGCAGRSRQRVRAQQARREGAHLDLDTAALAELTAARVEKLDALRIADAAAELLERRDELGVVLAEDLRKLKVSELRAGRATSGRPTFVSSMILKSHSALRERLRQMSESIVLNKLNPDAPRLRLEREAPVPPLEAAPDRLALLVRARHATIDVRLWDALGALFVRHARVMQVELSDDVVTCAAGTVSKREKETGVWTPHAHRSACIATQPWARAREEVEKSRQRR